MLEILSIGSGLSIQDRGRDGWRRFGVPAGGAMDTRSMALANALLGNPRDAAVIEVVQQGAKIRLLTDSWLALAGGDFCSRCASGTAMPFARGQVLEFDQKSAGLYAYLALPGGVEVERWLGSAAIDARNGMGIALQKGSHIAAQLTQPKISTQAVARRISSIKLDHIPAGKAHFSLYPGPQFDAFEPRVRQCFLEHEWTVSPRSDRTGYRLEGTKLDIPQSIASEPVLPGSFQIPGNGQPIITMADGPTVGGYPQLALLAAGDLDRLAQCAPGTKLTFSWLQ
ncbi:biotin-dependent carboxyltransferase family protein [Coraliomargarita algicola]|uniref:Biotin-dependent carboxyltransferase family protein n=1 Tax=Coraliomargarita algicola TaxID=3092156 RepID=A0ABZ0RJI9_9BACT|nr:biotin-dependent carboxyltransferase family protein [Coraliomargarita sp. J2-16]WPJ96375.1 biotin-dependent carboxyltransferase family protein [Coraliomargarita sp. J2-16]